MALFGKHDRRKLAQRYIAALNAQDLDAIRAAVADDITALDATGASLSGKDAYMEACERFFALDDQFRFEVTEYTPRGDVVLLRGHTRSRHPQLCTDELWHLRFDGDLLCEWQSFAHSNPVPLIKLLAGQTKPASA